MSDELYTALRNAEAAGDTAGAKRIADYIRASADAQTHKEPFGVSKYGINVTADQERVHRDVLDQMNGPQRFFAGMGGNLNKILNYTGNKVGLVSDDTVKEAERIDTPLNQTPGGAGGDFAGGMTWTTLPAMGTTSAISTLGKTGGMIAANPIARGAIEGAVQGGLQSPKGQTLEGMTTGGAMGALIPGGIATVKKVASGLDVTPEARSLLNRGIDLTPGQMNAKGIANHLESSWESVPVMGPMITGARKNAENQYKQALIMEAAAPGAKLAANKDLSALLDDAYKSFDPAYAPAKKFPIQTDAKGVPVTGANRTLAHDFADAAADQNVLASDETRRTAGDWLKNQLTKKPKETGDLIAMRSQIRSKIRGIKGTSKDDQATREIFENAEHSITAAIDNWLPPDVSTAVKAADAQYGKFKIVENAVAKGGDKDFTTFQATKAVREATDKGEYARGGGRLRDLTSAGAETFVERPETGARLASIALPAAAMGAKPFLAIPAAAGMAGLTLTKTGRNLASGSTPFQQGLQRQINQIPNYSSMLPEELRRQLGMMLRSGTVQRLGIQPGTTAAASE